MKTMKKLLAIPGLIALCLILCACGSTKTANPEATPAPEPTPSPVETPAAEEPAEDMTVYIKSQLGIPADLETEDIIDFDNASYWEAGEMWLVNCEFYHDGKLVAAALVDRDTGEPARNILPYTGD